MERLLKTKPSFSFLWRGLFFLVLGYLSMYLPIIKFRLFNGLSVMEALGLASLITVVFILFLSLFQKEDTFSRDAGYISYAIGLVGTGLYYIFC